MNLLPYVHVAIPNVPKDTLTYAVPEGLADDVAIGKRVVAPLGRRLTTGYIVGMQTERPDMQVKAIQEILDPAPVFPESILKLCGWISRYYLCSLGDALKAALPQGIDVDSERYVSLASNDAELLSRAIGKSKAKQQIVDALASGELMSEAKLLDAVGVKSIAPQLRDLMMEGVIHVESIVDRPQARIKTINVVRLLAPWNRSDKLQELMEILETRAPKQVNVLAVLWTAFRQNKLTVPMTDLVRDAKASSQTVRALEEKEIIEVLEEEALREYSVLYEEEQKEFSLTADQRAALETLAAAIEAEKFEPFLLHGVTSSGKTQVYIDAIRKALERGKTAMVLVPEIALTPQLVSRFRAAFGKDVAVLHSRMSVGERYDAWRQILQGKRRIVVGVRSAIFAPLENVGLIVVDEEHDSSYKQFDMIPRYHGRDAAVMRAMYENAVVLLGSATPSAESYHNALAGKYRLIDMPRRIDGTELPVILPVDTTEARRQNTMRGAFSLELTDAVRDRIARKETCIILHNRRGFAPHIECADCGFVENCDNCSISMVYHKDKNLLRCHYCGATRKLSVVCPTCGGEKLELEGIGTQRVEEDLKTVIPAARILRMDFDTTRRKGAHDLLLTAFAGGEADVLLGTQMVAKGLDFERVTLVGVISAEQSLLLPDFRAGERTFQLLTQVSGRSGRGAVSGEVIIQASKADHPILRKVYEHDYAGFIAEELESRKLLQYPPFTRLVLIEFSGIKEEQVKNCAEAYFALLRPLASFYRMHSPQPALLKKIKNRFRFHLLLRIEKKADPDGARLRGVLDLVREEYLRRNKSTAVRVDVDVDPQGMM